MPIARKTKSGSWSCVVDLGTVDGKRKQKRFTVSDPSRDGKKKCEQLAAEYARKRRISACTSVHDCVCKYIQSKEQMLSPATLRGYMTLRDNAYKSIDGKDASNITAYDLQSWMTSFAVDHAPKTCANARSLLIASLNMQYPDVRYRVTLPARQAVEYYTPTDEDVAALLRASTGELRKAILLGMLGLRRGEICALTADDIQRAAVRVSKSVACVHGGGYVVKSPKTAASARIVPIPKQFEKELTPTNGKIVDLTPQGLTKRFETARKSAGLPPFRFHDLRAYSISARHALGIPDQYIIGASGHATDSVMKRVYRREMEDAKKKFDKLANDHFGKILSPKKSQKKSQSSQK